MSSKTARGAIHWSDSVTIHEKNLMLDCESSYSYSRILPLTAPHSYQRLYFRNANHPIARPSVITRRQDRNTANLQNKALDQNTEREEDRRLAMSLVSSHARRILKS